MKHEKILTVLAAFCLALITGLGAAGCLQSAFDLPLAHPAGVALGCAGAALGCSVLLALPRGGLALACLAALGCGYLWQDGRALEQLWQLAHRLSVIYNRAYGCGVLVLPETLGTADAFDWPVGLLGALSALAVSRCICRKTTVWVPVLVTLAPLCSCIVVTNTVPGELWLLGVMAGLILLLLTADLRRENSFQALRLLALSAFPVVAALILLFLAAPQKNYVNYAETIRDNILTAARHIPQLMDTGLRQIAGKVQGNTQKQVDLAHLGARIPFTYPVMEVTAQRGGTLYLREQDFDRYDGLGWASTEDRQEYFFQPSDRPEVITIATRNRKPLRFLTYHPGESTRLTAGCLENDQGDTVYTLLRSSLPDNWRAIAAQAPGSAPQEWSHYTQLPQAARQGGQALLTGLFSADASNTEKADAIAALVTGAARYDLNPGTMPQGETDFALWFLRDGQSGYCVHFATAAAVLLRAADVPARYVTGYMTQVEPGREITVTEEDAHAWAEYYEPNLGLWLPLEATPASDPQPEPSSGIQAPSPTEATVPTTSATQPSTVPPPTETDAPMPSVTEPLPPEAPEPVPMLPLVLLSALALLLPVQRWLRLTLRQRRQRSGDTNRQALHRWQQTRLLARLLGEPAPKALLELAQKAKFSQHALTREELRQFDSHNQRCLARLREKPWYLGLLYKYLYALY